MFSGGHKRITYNVYNEDELTRSFEQRGFRKIITPDVLQFRPKEASFYPPLVPDAIPYDPSFKDTLNVHVKNSVVIDGLKVPNQMLVRTFKNSITQDRVVNYIIYQETIYQDYITVLSAQWKAAHELREKEQKVSDEYKSSKAYYDEQRELRGKYPIMSIESYDKYDFPSKT
ncbi:hypothetical protein ES692_14875 [Psychroserpens burtonensis]|uniref:Uncharacterized protein n=1 Tax=Psychroserpens burtonensis TaxID=49278 RepID=A0A5C7B5N8_9FLAO|nr:hypothetical protein [Psychroserpens burtonensis]TXE15901.1 hypothetical protein ES692_14875 [Psychroserpens burtonensis]